MQSSNALARRREVLQYFRHGAAQDSNRKLPTGSSLQLRAGRWYPSPEPESALRMESEDYNTITALLVARSKGDRHSLDALIPLVYQELKDAAHRHLKRERPDRALNTASLIHEAYLRLVDQRVSWQGRGHFFAISSKIMRRILVDHARSLRASRRGDGVRPVSLDDVQPAISADSNLVLLDAALNKFERLDPSSSEIVEMRFFGGLTNEEIAQILGGSSITVQRRWVAAKAWLQSELVNRSGTDHGG